VFSECDLTCDGFLDGRLRLWQPRQGYRAGSDPVFLAAAVPARAGQTVLELGCGAGAAALCLGWRVRGIRLTGVERQPAYAALARRNAAENGIPLEVVQADLAALPDDLRARSFDHVIANPPYLEPGRGTPAGDSGKEQAFREETPLSMWLDVATRRLAPGGWLTMIMRASRLAALLRRVDDRLGSISVLPLAGRQGAVAGRILMRARKGGRGEFRLLAPIVLHEGATHTRDGDSYAATAQRVLRDGKPLEF